MKSCVKVYFENIGWLSAKSKTKCAEDMNDMRTSQIQIYINISLQISIFL
jgi:hypothetical protein